MEEIKKEKLDKARKIGYLICPVVLMVIAICSKGLIYFASDDAMMNNIARGFFNGKTDEHLIFINVVFGYLTKGLYAITNQVNWFGVIYILLILLCVYVIMNVFKKHSNLLLAFVAGLLIECLCIYWFTFTVIAYVCVLTGVIKLVDYLTSKDEKYKTWNVVLVVVLFVFAYVLRDSSFISGFLVLLPLLIFNFKKIEDKKKLLVLAPVVICILCCFVLNKFAYSSNMWKDYTKFNTLRSEVIDHPVSEYKEAKDFYKSIGYSENDLYCATHWCFGDKTVFSPKNYKKIIKNTPFSTRYCVSLKQLWSLRRYYVKFALIFGLSAVALILIAALTILKGKKLCYILQVLFGIGFVMVTIFINKPITRVVIPMLILTMFALVYMYVTDESEKAINFKKYYTRVVVVVFAVMSVAFIYKTVTNAIELNNRNEKAKEVYAYVKDHADSLYLCQAKERLLYNKPVMEMVGSDICENVMQTGDQDIYNNCYYDQLNNLGVKKKDTNRLLMNLINRPKTYLIVDEKEEPKIKEMVNRFLWEHSGKIISCHDKKSFNNNIKIYQFTK
ncbi:MAG: hypothetical protein K6E58_06715 [Eubacterium sp.]|nr:hypothetical protein [Eubacterium sp.]